MWWFHTRKWVTLGAWLRNVVPAWGQRRNSKNTSLWQKRRSGTFLHNCVLQEACSLLGRQQHCRPLSLFNSSWVYFDYFSLECNHYCLLLSLKRLYTKRWKRQFSKISSSRRRKLIQLELCLPLKITLPIDWLSPSYSVQAFSTVIIFGIFLTLAASGQLIWFDIRFRAGKRCGKKLIVITDHVNPDDESRHAVDMKSQVAGWTKLFCPVFTFF